MTRKSQAGSLNDLVQLGAVRKQTVIGEYARLSRMLSDIDAQMFDLRGQSYTDGSLATAVHAARWEDWKQQEQARLNVKKASLIVAQRNLLAKLGHLTAEHEVLQHLAEASKKQDATVKRRRRSYTS